MIFSFNWCKNTVLLFVLTLFACGNQTKKSLTHVDKMVAKIEADTTKNVQQDGWICRLTDCIDRCD